jgi:regulator of RNase E activity RraA
VDYSEILDRLAALDTCAISDALDSLGVSGTVDGIVRRSTRERIAGRVRTMKVGAGPAPEKLKTHLGSRSIAEANETDVIVVEQRTGINAACWGGVLAHAAKLKRVRGIIIEGSARDVDEIGEVGIPVFSRGVSTKSARGRIHEAEVNVDIQVGDVVVKPGDLVVADGTGVVFIPAAIAEEAISKAELISATENSMIDAIHEGKPVTEVLGRQYETMLEDEKSK